MRGPTIRDVAVRAGTSTAVVSYVLNGGPRPVAAATRERVLRAVDDLGYRRNNLARALRAKRSGTIGLVVPDLAKPFFADLSSAIEDAAYARNLRLLVGNTRFDPDREYDQVYALLDARVDAVLLVPSDDPARCVDLLRETGTAHLLVHRAYRDSAHICGDDIDAGRQAARHLLDHGHTRIALLTGPGPDTPVGRRTEGARAMLAEAGAPVPDALVVTCAFPDLRDNAQRATAKLLTERPDVTALCATTDEHALGALRAVAEAGRRVGDDMALVSIDGTAQSAYLTPPLTTVALPFAALAVDAIEQLLSSDATAPVARRHRLDLIRRRTCGCDQG